MNLRSPFIAAVFAAFVLPVSAASPYSGQESRAIKALSAEDVEGYLAGKGMGLARAAELNGYPGPAHVLELASQLDLNEEQRARTQQIFAAMQASASELGRELVERERALDTLFATQSADGAKVAALLQEIGVLQARLRGAHLEAHLSQVKVLTGTQVARYSQLRGYAAPEAAGAHRHKH